MKHVFTLLMTAAMLLATSSLMAQSTPDQPVQVFYGETRENQPLDIRIGIQQQGVRVERAILRYRNFGISEYRFVEAQPRGNEFVATIPERDMVAPSMEYYVVVITGNNTQLTFPALNPAQTPASLTIQSIPEDPNVFAISPGRTDEVNPEDVVISFSFYPISDKVSREKSSFLVDGKNVTSQVMYTDNLVTYVPKVQPRRGPLRAEFIARDASGKILGSGSTFFRVGGIIEPGTVTVADQKNRFVYASQNWGELRREQIGDTTINYGRGYVSIDGRYNEWLGIGGSAYITNEENSRRQPSNRYFGRLSMSFLDVRVGDLFPDYTFYLSNGVRVRGYEVDLRGAGLRLAFTQGQTVREIGSSTLAADSGIVRVDTLDVGGIARLQIQGYTFSGIEGNRAVYRLLNVAGTPQQNYFTAIAGFNTKAVRLELQYLKAKDVLPNQNFNTFGIPARENAGVGLSFRLSPVLNRWDMFADAAVTLNNRDITGGSLSEADVKKVFGITADISGPYNFFNNIITINQNLIVPYRFAGSLAARAGTNLTLDFGDVNNFFRFEYLWQGTDFRSFGLAFYQPDVGGFRITNRTRFLQGRVFFNLGFEGLQDNLLSQRNIIYRPILNDPRTTRSLDATSNRNLFSVGTTVFPGQGLPTFRVEYRYQLNNNSIPDFYRRAFRLGGPTTQDIGVYNTASIDQQQNNNTNTFVGDIQQNFLLKGGATWTFGISGTYSTRNDKRNFNPLPAFASGDTTVDGTRGRFVRTPTGANPNDSTFFSNAALSVVPQDLSSRFISITTGYKFENDVRLNFGYSNQQSEFFVRRIDTLTGRPAAAAAQIFNSLDGGVGFGLFSNRLRPSVRVSFTFGDFQRQVYGAGFNFDITPSMLLSADVSALTVSARTINGFAIPKSNDLIAAMRYQYSFGN
jgi:hypothetical protein